MLNSPLLHYLLLVVSAVATAESSADDPGSHLWSRLSHRPKRGLDLPNGSTFRRLLQLTDHELEELPPLFQDVSFFHSTGIF